MNLFIKILIITLAILLPWHGAISVFCPTCVWWKEIIFASLFGIVTYKEIQNLFITKKFPKLSVLEIISKTFIAWCFVLLIIGKFDFYQILAVRYLIFGSFVFLILSRLWTHLPTQKEKLFQTFSQYFIYSATFSTIFGLWVKFGNGFDWLTKFYSSTISSWVPGQKIPIFHTLSDGTIRLSGASSGPIEFSHLMLGALFLSLLYLPAKLADIKKHKYLHLSLESAKIIILLIGIWQSYSRAAWLGSLIIIGGWLLSDFWLKLPNIARQIFITFLVIIGFASIILTPKIINRASDSDHFTRPLFAIQQGLKKPFLGNLSHLGPAARTRNLNETNNDQAPLAENVFADVFAQTGAIGLFLYLAFWGYLLKISHRTFYPFLIAAFITANLATIFDMTPIPITYFTIFAFIVHSNKNKKTTHLLSVNNLKKP